jgi:hypothetical protein
MSLVYPVVYDGSAGTRQGAAGDVLARGEQIATLTTVGAGTITAAMIAAGIISRTGPVGGYTDTTDTAANIIAQLTPNVFVGTGSFPGGMGSSGGVQTGLSFRIRYINTVAQAMTLAAGTGVTLGSNVNVSASSTKEYLVTITNGTPVQTFVANTNTSTAITGMSQAQTNQLSVGMLVSGTGVQSGSLITAITPGVGVTLSLATTATATGVTLTFSPTVRIDSLGQTLL